MFAYADDLAGLAHVAQRDMAAQLLLNANLAVYTRCMQNRPCC